MLPATFSFNPSDIVLPDIHLTLPYPFYSSPIGHAEQDLWIKAYRHALWRTLPPSLRVSLENRAALFNLNSSHSTWQSLAWELLYQQKITFYRSHPNLPILSSAIPFPLSILLLQFPVLFKNNRLALEQEQWLIQQQLLPYQTQINFTVSMVDSLSELSDLLTQKKWTAIILSGHALMTREWDNDKLQLFINANCSLTGQQLAALLSKNPPYLLLLNTCLSGMIPKNPEKSLLYPLLSAGINHLIAMQGQLLDRAALKFVQSFLQGIIQAQSVLQSVELGRQAMQQLLNKNEVWHAPRFSDPSAHQHFLPVYYSQCPHDILLPNTIAIIEEIKRPPIATSIFIGRHKLIQSIFSILIEKNFNSVLLQGVKGCGKTALANELIRLLRQHAISVKTGMAEMDNRTTNLSDFIYFLDNPNFSQWEKIQQQWQSLHPPRYLLISENKMTTIKNPPVKTFIVPLADYADFLAYAQQLGLPHDALQIRLMYRFWAARFRGLEILRSLPLQTGKKLHQQITQIKRCLNRELSM